MLETQARQRQIGAALIAHCAGNNLSDSRLCAILSRDLCNSSQSQLVFFKVPSPQIIVIPGVAIVK